VSAGTASTTISVTISSSFDDTDGHWAMEYIEYLKNNGVVNGVETEKGTYFYPDQKLTRAEFCTMLSRFMEIDTGLYTLDNGVFSDYDSIPGWAGGHVAAMYSLGYVNGKTSGDGLIFDANASITRAEAFTILGRIMSSPTGLGYDLSSLEGYIADITEESGEAADMEATEKTATVETPGAEKETETGETQDTMEYGEAPPEAGEAQVFLQALSFMDAGDIPDWAAEYMEMMAEMGILSGYEDGTVRPNNTITRAEAAKIICCLYE